MEEKELKEENQEVRIEIHFYSTNYWTLLQHLDIKGILLKAHINWLGQTLTHCGFRIVTPGLDMLYQATWDGLRMWEYKTCKYPPHIIIDVTPYVLPSFVLDNLSYLFKYAATETIDLDQLLLLMCRKPERVTGMMCTSFIIECLGYDLKDLDVKLLYPDNLCKEIQYRINHYSD